MTPAERRAYALGRESFSGGRDDDAMTWLTLLVKTRSDYADVHYMLGVLHERRNDTASAARSLREALRINPAYTEAALALAGVYEQEGDYDRSREIAQRARALGAGDGAGLDPTTRGKLANLQADLGDAYARAGELREAIDAYRKALDRCPTFHDIRFRLGVTLREAGLPDRALAEFGRILRANPDFAEAGIQRALTLYSLGRWDEAIREMRGLAAAHPDRADAPMYLRLLTAGRAAGGAD